MLSETGLCLHTVLYKCRSFHLVTHIQKCLSAQKTVTLTVFSLQEACSEVRLRLILLSVLTPDVPVTHSHSPV